jgi:hypothetical protein
MILSDLRDYLATRGRTSLVDLRARFQVDDDALRGMLDVWIRKGRVRRLDATCSGCCGCGGSAEVYEWVKPDRT